MEQDTEIAQTVGAEEFNSVDLAWSEDSAQWRTPTYPYRPRGPWGRRILAVAKYALPAVIVGAVVMLVMGGHHAQQESPMPAPPTAALPTYNPAPIPSASQDDKFLQTLVDGGFRIENRREAIQTAHWVCSYLSDGHSKADISKMWDAQDLPGQTKAEEHINNQQWVDIATKVYCPDFNV